MIHRHDTECNNKIRFYAKMTPSLFMGRKHTQIRIPNIRSGDSKMKSSGHISARRDKTVFAVKKELIATSVIHV